jgi:Protein of unknown function (DUF3999)
MFKKNTFYLILILLFFHHKTEAQKGFEYRRPLTGINAMWHTLTLPDSVYERLYTEEDFRIIGFTKKGDTVEVPYIFKGKNGSNTEGVSSRSIAFKILNQSHNQDGFYYTFESPTAESLNTIQLNFNNKNFDWRIRLEGSFNQNEWFTLLDNYRIVGISNSETDYQFTKLNFKEATYRFWRVRINSTSQPELASAELYKFIKTEINYIKTNTQGIDIQQLKEEKETVGFIELKQIVPFSFIKINVKDTLDYVRRVSIEYRNEEKTSRPIWHTITTASLSSLSDNIFEFNAIKAKHLKITVRNGDNKPLGLGEIEIQTIPTELIARFTEPANYFFFYGNKKASPPQYDIENFRKNIPKDLFPILLGLEETNDNTVLKPSEPFFKNKLWLWGIMLIIMLALGWQTMKMMKAQG